MNVCVAAKRNRANLDLVGIPRIVTTPTAEEATPIATPTEEQQEKKKTEEDQVIGLSTKITNSLSERSQSDA